MLCMDDAMVAVKLNLNFSIKSNSPVHYNFTKCTSFDSLCTKILFLALYLLPGGPFSSTQSPREKQEFSLSGSVT